MNWKIRLYIMPVLVVVFYAIYCEHGETQVTGFNVFFLLLGYYLIAFAPIIQDLLVNAGPQE